MVALVVGLNSWGSLAEADAYLDASARAAARWAATSTDNKSRALISAWRILDRQAWNGEAVPGLLILELGTITDGGTGWAVDDVGEIAGGLRAARFKVLTEAAGVITSVQLLDAGFYSAVPSSPAAFTAVTGSGTAGTINVTTAANPSAFPRSGLEDCEGNALTDTGFPDEIKFAQFELAFDISVSAAAETAAGIGSNVARVKAGSAEVEFFRPTGGVNGAGSPRFPVYVMEWIQCLLAGGTGTGFAGSVSGVGSTSIVADYPNDFGLVHG